MDLDDTAETDSGYAVEMNEEFIHKEMELLHDAAKRVEIMFARLGGLAAVAALVGGKSDPKAWTPLKRSADVVANSDGVLLRLSQEVMLQMVDKQAEVVVPFLVEVAKKLAESIRADNARRKKDTILRQSRH